MTNEDRIHILREQNESWMRWAAQNVMPLINKCNGNCVFHEKEVKETYKVYERLRSMATNMFTPDVVYPGGNDNFNQSTEKVRL